MKKLLIRVLTVCIPISLCALAGCMLPYSATGIDTPLEFREDFLEVNRTYGAVWPYDETIPKFRTFIITEKARLDEVFSVYPEIDFEQEMVLMYGFTSICPRKIKITNITLDKKKLKINFKYKAGNGSNDTSAPRTRFLVIRMDKLDIDTVEFTLLNPRG